MSGGSNFYWFFMKTGASIAANIVLPGGAALFDLVSAGKAIYDGDYIGCAINLASAAVTIGTAGLENIAKDTAKVGCKKAAVEVAKENAKTAGKEAAKKAIKAGPTQAAIKNVKSVAATAVKQANKNIGQELAENIAKNSIEGAAKDILIENTKTLAKNTGKEITKTVGKNFGKDFAKEATKKATKEVSKKVGQKLGKDLAKGLVKNVIEEVWKEGSKVNLKSVAFESFKAAASKSDVTNAVGDQLLKGLFETLWQEQKHVIESEFREAVKKAAIDGFKNFSDQKMAIESIYSIIVRFVK